ncbi:MAG: hypothetical protein RL136_777 [Planctomycetota bacterium]|jgi:tetratricopeptide (TPR) repeat protein
MPAKARWNSLMDACTNLPDGLRSRSTPLAVLSAALLTASACTTRAPLPTQPVTTPELAPRAEQPALEVRVKPNESESARLGVARGATAADDYDTALRLFRELLAENPTLAEAYTGIGEVHESRGELELAEPAYARAVSLDPGDFTAVSSHGRVLEALGRARDAVKAFQRALMIRPRDLDSNLAMSRLMIFTGQAESAVVFAERAARIDPENGAARLQLARAYLEAGRGGDAIREYEAACELVDPPADVMFALINAYARELRYQEAANAAEALTRTEPSAAAYERLGWTLFRLNRYRESDEAYRRAIELDPEYWPALNGAGINALNAWIQAGKPDNDARRYEARTMLQRSLRANPDQPKLTALLLKYRP